FFFQAEDGIRDDLVTGVQTCALPISASIQTLMARLSPPTIATSPTPAARSSWVFTTLSASSVISRRERSDDSARVMTGARSLLNFEMSGGSVPAGRLRRTVA